MNIDLDKFKNQLKALALLIFGVLIFFICLDFYVWPEKYMCSGRTTLEGVWRATVPIAVSILIFMELFREKLNMEKHHDGLTFVIYELILILSILTQIQSSMAYMWSNEKRFGSFQNSLLEAGLLRLSDFIGLISIIYCCSYWLRNSVAHSSLYNWKLCGLEPIELNIKWSYVPDVCFFMNIMIFVLYSLLGHLNMNNVFSVIPISPIAPTFAFAILSDTQNITKWHRNNDKRGIWMFYSLAILTISQHILLVTFDALNYPCFIWTCICWLSIGRQMLLEPELDPEKYKLWWQIISSSERHNHNNRASMAFEDIEANLVVAIFDSSVEGVIMPMDKMKYDKLFESINNTLITDIFNDKLDVTPTFVSSQYTRGVMKIGCSSNEAKYWLSQAIEYKIPLWHNMQLKIVDFDKLPSQNRVLGKFPNCIHNAEQIHRILIAMNPEFNIACWTILGSKTTENVMHIAFRTDKLQLSKRYFKLYFGVGYAKFRDISEEQLEPWMCCSDMAIESPD